MSALSLFGTCHFLLETVNTRPHLDLGRRPTSGHRSDPAAADVEARGSIPSSLPLFDRLPSWLHNFRSSTPYRGGRRASAPRQTLAALETGVGPAGRLPTQATASGAVSTPRARARHGGGGAKRSCSASILPVAARCPPPPHCQRLRVWHTATSVFPPPPAVSAVQEGGRHWGCHDGRRRAGRVRRDGRPGMTCGGWRGHDGWWRRW